MTTLRDELLNDPLGRGYAGMNDQQAADDLNTVYRQVARFVSVEDVRQYLVTQLDGTGVNQRNSLDMIREYATSGTVRGADAGETAKEARQSGAQMIWTMLQIEEAAAFPVDNTNVRAQFIAIGPDSGNGPSVLTGAQLNAIDDLAQEMVSRAQELGIQPLPVKPGHVQMARQI